MEKKRVQNSTNLNLANNFPKKPCTGTNSRSTANPAKTDEPSSRHSIYSIITDSMGATHRK